MFYYRTNICKDSSTQIHLALQIADQNVYGTAAPSALWGSLNFSKDRPFDSSRKGGRGVAFRFVFELCHSIHFLFKPKRVAQFPHLHKLLDPSEL
ncbi:hypothetical protein CDAR_210951 [Caerostris darwini]|uniref:Uncharacterized protein n=1 Tax=Caerostris darwini TaxID=1538125 RepID=A0AAV4SDP7_9ARAC|nr:hypothetical protein CDAR_210951 [Caerostris darwini]